MEAAVRKIAQIKVLAGAQRKMSEGEWEQANTLLVATDKKEILVDQFTESNPNAVKILQFAHSTGFSIQTEVDGEVKAVVVN
jgi:methionyl-tRNA formyltransferase